MLRIYLTPKNTKTHTKTHTLIRFCIQITINEPLQFRHIPSENNGSSDDDDDDLNSW